MTLHDQKCVPCQGGIPPLSAAEANALLAQVPGWSLSEDTTLIRRRFSFKNFHQAMEFALKVGDLADAEGHHPVLTVAWGGCTVEFQTHKIKGLHENDFIMAAKVSALAG